MTDRRDRAEAGNGREIPVATQRPAHSREGIGPEIPCACGCGAKIQQFDAEKRERRFVNGHYLKWLTRKLAEARVR